MGETLRLPETWPWDKPAIVASSVDPRLKAYSGWGKPKNAAAQSLAKLRKRCGPLPVLRPCPRCGVELGAGAMRRHHARCPKNPRVINERRA